MEAHAILGEDGPIMTFGQRGATPAGVARERKAAPLTGQREGTPFSRFLDERLRAKRMSGRELARRAGLSPTTPSDWRQGKVVPSLESILAIAPHLDIPAYVLTDLVNRSIAPETAAQGGGAGLPHRLEVVWAPTYRLQPSRGERVLIGYTPFQPTQFLSDEERARFFAILVENDDLAPLIEAGTCVVFDPLAPRTSGRPAVVEIDGGERVCILQERPEGWVCLCGMDGPVVALPGLRLAGVGVFSGRYL